MLGGDAGGARLGCLLIAPISQEGRKRNRQIVVEREENQIKLSHRGMGKCGQVGRKMS